MGTEYEKVEVVEAKISEWLKGRFLKERLLFGEMAELMIESLKPLGEYRRDTAEGELALLTLASRMFNDSEGAKQLLLWGLPDQAQPVIRDIIECSLLFRLFLWEPKIAKKWLMSLAEYHPGDINAKLLEFGVDAKEFSLYGMLSHVGHSNLLASLSHVQEMDVGEQGMLRVFHFGSSRNAEAEYFVQQAFLLLFFLLYIALKEPLAELYYRYSEWDVFETWYAKVDNLLPRLENFSSELTIKSVGETVQIDPTIEELVKKKMRFQEFKRRLTDDGDLPLKS
jgi:hypothetical protein